MTDLPMQHSTGVMLAMINGRIVAEEDFKVSAYDRGLYFGDGVYEVIQTYVGKMWGPELHFQRFERSLRELRIDNAPVASYRQWVDQAFDAVERQDCMIYFHVTRGCGVRSHVPTEALQPQFLLMVKHCCDNVAKVRDGIGAITYPDIRWKRCDIKSLNLMANVMARQEAAARGAGEAIFIDDHGMLTEAAVSSVFTVEKGSLIVRPLGHEILPGLTRLAILAIANKIGIPIAERLVTVDALRRSDEIFVSGSGEEVRSVVRLDDAPIGTGKPGPVAMKIINEFIAYTRAGNSFEALIADHFPKTMALM